MLYLIILHKTFENEQTDMLTLEIIINSFVEIEKIQYLLNGLFNTININIYDKYIQYTYNDNIFGCINTFNKKILMIIFYTNS